MNLVFCGTPEFAVPTLRKLVEGGFDVRLVVTQPDRPSGRGQELTAPPVKQLAQSLGVPIVQPDRIKTNEEFRARLEAVKPTATVVVGYGRIIPKWMIDLPPLGNINLHASLLPKYRGAAPIQWAIARGETVTGVTTMHIDEGLDTGDILLQKEISIAPEDTAVTLAPRLAESGADLMVETLRGLEAGSITPRPQDHPQASLAPILKKEDGRVDFTLAAWEIVNRWRGFQPWPGAFTTLRSKNLTFHALRVLDQKVAQLAPGEIAIEDEHMLVGCGSGT
ncbi:MAG TPA: methionyl-tRNA formyltransferase, partial [Terriglobales bacterium]|nr:methionyl-tRNA formyltransferase [Terriglobales bacterium]